MRRALVTGCSSGIGRGVTRALLDAGWHVIGVSRTYPMCFQNEPEFDWESVDLSSGYRVDAATFRFGSKLDALVHAAAVQGPVDLLDRCEISEWLGCIRMNLQGAYHILRVALPFLRRADDARILLLAGGGAFSPRPRFSAYAASKGGVVSLMEALAAECEGSSVTANCVSPGYVPTPMHGLPDEDSPELERAVACITYLLSPACKGLSGRTVSAEYDDWGRLSAQTVPFVMASEMGTRTRRKIWGVDENGQWLYRTDANAAKVMV